MTTVAALLLWLTLSRSLFYLPALPADDRLQRVAQERADSVAATGYFSHCLPGTAGSGCVLAFVGLDAAAGVTNVALGENLFVTTGPDGPDMARTATLAWLASPGHLANIVNPAFRHVGFGLAVRRGPLLIGDGSGTTFPGPAVVITEELGGGMP